MTGVALAFSFNVPLILTRGRRSIVAQGTASGNSRVVVFAVWQAIQEVFGVVAIIALLACRNVVLGFADGHFTVVAFAAAPKDFLMVDSWDRGKIRIGVAGLAGIAGRHVIRRFAGRYHTVVTGCAVIDYGGVVEQRTFKAGGVVTSAAIVVCRNMRYRLAFGADREVVAIVAADAVFAHPLVIDGTAGKGVGAMAELAAQGGGNMLFRFTDHRHAMATVAVVDSVGMVKSGALKTTGSVAYATVLIGRNVIFRFTLSENPIVA